MISRILVLFLLIGSYRSAAFAQFTDSSALLAGRLKSIEKAVPLTYNRYVHAEIAEARSKSGSYTAEILGKAAVYLPDIESVLKTYGLPAELRYLPMAVSGFDNQRVNEAGGSGFWQISYKIAKRYGMHISTYVDERRNYIAATHVAAKHLKELYRQYNNWPLSIAAFYSDPVDVNKAIRLAGGKTDYWSIHPYLRPYEQEVMPSLIASAYILQYQPEEKFVAQAFELPETDSVLVQDWVSFSQISLGLDISIDELTLLNPIFKKKVVPHAGQTYALMLPKNKVQAFYELGDSLYRIKPESYMQGGEQLPEPAPAFSKPSETTDPEPEPKPERAAPTGTVTVYYVVKSGDYLGLIADIFDVNISDLRKLNGIQGDRINSNQRIKVVVPAAKEDYYKSMNKKTTAQKKQIANGD